jgi:hypothetical protein
VVPSVTITQAKAPLMKHAAIPISAHADQANTSNPLLQLLLATPRSGLHDAFPRHCLRCSFPDLPMSFLAALMALPLLFNSTQI